MGLRSCRCRFSTKGQLHDGAVVGLEHDDGHLAQARHPGRAPTPLARNDLIESAAACADGQRLQDAVGGNGIRQSLQLLLVKRAAGLIRIRLHLLQRQLRHRAALGFFLKIADQRAKPSAQPTLLLHS